MKYLKKDWKFRSSILLIVSVLVSALLILLEMTDWAAQINLNGYSHGSDNEGKKDIPSFLMYVLPFVKELVLIGVPMFISLMLIKLLGKKR
ncbi:hypothetical protein [Colwellia sp. E2M01]|uniref:hypothetical protein n=1 Tax=Colwellia sp. E2M01 TaxID=2841561 RepID=UPI001C08915B|nr:hypothetical protein [Colwellia sp. E2M01]MBU2871410.1 hypothetical protein [Colwellia sp. E2M01]